MNFTTESLTELDSKFDTLRHFILIEAIKMGERKRKLVVDKAIILKAYKKVMKERV